MNLLALQEISKQYEHKVLLNRVNLCINKGERIAIVGKNGSGKSSLLNIILGRLEIDSGERMSIRGLKILSLEQKPLFKPNMSVYEVLLESMSEIKAAHTRLLEISTLITQAHAHHTLDSEISESSTLPKALSDEYNTLSAFLDEMRGWDIDQRAEEILAHFELEEFRNRLANSLSGGEQKRVALASLLLKPCDILLLDEPTNHLDVEMVAFLEQFLLECATTLVFISHDRYFIDRLATRIVEIDEGVLRSFDGGYMEYLSKKEEILKNLKEEHQKLLKLLKSEEEWLRRGIKARLKRNEGRKSRILAMREEAKKNPSLIRKMRLELEREQKGFNKTQGTNNQKCLFEIEGLHKSLGGKKLIDHLNLRILRNEKIAIVGKNGSGKSSFLKMLLGELAPDSGIIKVGDVRIGYFDQHTSLLDPSKDLLETFCPHGGEHIQVRGKNLHVYGYLKNFLFPKEFLTQKISALSGGEKNRVALALLFTKEVDVLILDEPTNDLDISTINIVEEYLLSLSCAVLFVSHDRYFVDKLAQKLLIFEGHGRVSEGHILYSEYLEIQKELKEMNAFEKELNSKEADSQTSHTQASHTQNLAHNPPPTKPQKLSYNEQRALKSLPDEIDALEKAKATLQARLADPKEYEKYGISALAKELEELESTLEDKIEQYLSLEQKSLDLREAKVR